ncbi:TadE/TadG family type IV pilus assembly protein [Vibrio breoganii]|uniref:Pilus assembly protein n=1 Tax=Vibrio breoganii TaxID=553239 RepID=A0AAP8MWX7_9VIBR|nr:TadE/TadG family type IV pilus assembly protein [Vibrio breoganii]NMO73303.1 pilus assembly protein [Vibrio breoganii]NMR69692.1 pilus assembly protein [Vibrio breoganii]PMF77143.1 hypothetical protein BCV08_02460 [Vibrio breoganii]PMG06033.1 hypothetical protein BCV02_04335 [Vibrio breoganii]PMG99816.1 hypothetical protein BCU80_02845 [Vibrio breoganii]
MLKTKRTFKTKSKGLAAIEMMIVLPILLLLMGAIFEVGRIFIHYTMLNKALQNGARYAVLDVYGTDRSNLVADETEIKNIVVYGNKSDTVGDNTLSSVLPGLTRSNISVDDSLSDYISISADYAYSPVFSTIPIIGTAFSLNMTASSLMRVNP